jgi:hypothetical protein
LLLYYNPKLSLLVTIADDYFWNKEIIGCQILNFTCPLLSSGAIIDNLGSISDWFDFSAADSSTEFDLEQPLPRDFLYRQNTPDANPNESKLLP